MSPSSFSLLRIFPVDCLDNFRTGRLAMASSLYFCEMEVALAQVNSLVAHVAKVGWVPLILPSPAALWFFLRVFFLYCFLWWKKTRR